MEQEDIAAAVNAATGTTMCITRDARDHFREAFARLTSLQSDITDAISEFDKPPAERWKSDNLKSSLVICRSRITGSVSHLRRMAIFDPQSQPRKVKP
jgi:hypothetical protein